MSAPAPRRVRVQIDREGGRTGRPYESFHGLVLAETTTHYRVRWIGGNDALCDEWFAKDGPRVQCVLLDEGLSPLQPEDASEE